jgi:hypothetical protein
MRTESNAMPLLEIVLLVLLGSLSGVPYALTKISLATIPPITMVAARVSLAAIVLWIIVFTLKLKVPKRTDLIPRLFYPRLPRLRSSVHPACLWLAFGRHRTCRDSEFYDAAVRLPYQSDVDSARNFNFSPIVWTFNRSDWCRYGCGRECVVRAWPIDLGPNSNYSGHGGVRRQHHSQSLGREYRARDHGGRNVDIRRYRARAGLFCC